MIVTSQPLENGVNVPSVVWLAECILYCTVPYRLWLLDEPGGMPPRQPWWQLHGFRAGPRARLRHNSLSSVSVSPRAGLRHNSLSFVSVSPRSL